MTDLPSVQKGIIPVGDETFRPQEVEKKMSVLKRLTNLPVVIGFGIKDGKTASSLKLLADGIVVGSVLVDIMGGKKDKIQNELSIKINDLFQALSVG